MQAIFVIYHSPALRLAVLAMLALGVMNASIGPYLALIAIEKVGLSETAFALVLAAAAVVAVVAAVVLGVLGDQRGQRYGIAVMTALASFVGLAMMLVAPSPLALVLCHAVLFPLGSALYGQVFALAQLAGPNGVGPNGTGGAPAGLQDSVLGAIRAAMSVSFMAVLLGFTFSFARGMDVMWVYVTGIIAAGALVVMVWGMWPRGAGVTWQDRPSQLNLRAALAELARPLIASRLVILGCINACTVLYFVLIALVFEASPTRGAADVALYVAIVAAWEVPFLILLPRLMAYISRSALMAIGAVAYGLHVLLLPIWVDSAWLWLGTLIAGLGGTAIIGLPIAYFQDLLADRPGAAGAMLALQKLVSDILGAAAFGIGMALGGFMTVAVIGFCLTFGGAVALWLADHRRWLMPKAAAQTVR
jgi:SET family sugar efflux transporter-like MFS transporter